MESRFSNVRQCCDTAVVHVLSVCSERTQLNTSWDRTVLTTSFRFLANKTNSLLNSRQGWASVSSQRLSQQLRERMHNINELDDRADMSYPMSVVNNPSDPPPPEKAHIIANSFEFHFPLDISASHRICAHAYVWEWIYFVCQSFELPQQPWLGAGARTQPIHLEINVYAIK